MEFEQLPIKVYVKLDEQQRIININSSIFLSDVAEWVEIDSGFGDKYAHSQSLYLENSLFDNNNLLNFKLHNGNVIERSKAEKTLDLVITTPRQNREKVYETDCIIEWEGNTVTVDVANSLWVAYQAESSPKASELSAKITTAKEETRRMFPNEQTNI